MRWKGGEKKGEGALIDFLTGGGAKFVVTPLSISSTSNSSCNCTMHNVSVTLLYFTYLQKDDLTAVFVVMEMLFSSHSVILCDILLLSVDSDERTRLCLQPVCLSVRSFFSRLW